MDAAVTAGFPTGGARVLEGGPREATGDRDPVTAPEEVLALLTLQRLPGIGDRSVWRLLERFGSAGAALAAPSKAFRSVVGSAGSRNRSAPEPRELARKAVEEAARAGLEIVTLHDPAWPRALRELHDPPAVLFAAGRMDRLDRQAVAIVGSRAATAAGRRIAERLGASLSSAGTVVVSGMALGIDAAAHRGALLEAAGTIAVLGGGADRASPRANARLYREIREQGLILSEFAPGATPLAHHFPRRNRLLAALSRAVVVVEASKRSGALITVDHALDLGREVFAVPGPVERPGSRGANALIRDGARILLEPAQLLEELGLEADRDAAPGKEPDLGSNPDAARLWEALSGEPRHVDDVAKAAGIGTARALAGLAALELDGWIVRRAGQRFARVAGTLGWG